MDFKQITEISSRQNPKAKQWLKLNSSQGVRKYQQIMVEGLRAAGTALMNQAKVEAFLFMDSRSGELIFQKILSGLIDVKNQAALDHFKRNSFRIEAELFQSLAQVVNPQGVILIIAKPQLAKAQEWLAKLEAGGQERIGLKLAFLDQVRDPGNLGTIIRTANAFAFSGLILLEGTVDPYNPKIIRSSMGSLFDLDLIEVKDYKEVQGLARSANLELISSDLDALALPDYRPTPAKKGFILGVGNEAHGISDEFNKMADTIVTIPMPGQTESLNAAVAFAIMAYQINEFYQ